MITLGDVGTSIYFQFRKRQYDSLEKKRIGIFHVTDYNQDCMRNSYYSHLALNGARLMDTNTMGIFFSGEAVHQLLDSSAPKGMGETALAYNFIDGKTVNLDDKSVYSKWGVLDWLKIIVGESDSLYKIEIDGKKEWVIVDYKTWLSKGYRKKEASPDHKVQINTYRYLFMKALGIDVKFGAVIYLDFADRMAKPLIFPFKTASMEEAHGDIKKKYELFLEAYNTGKLPPRVKSWKCDGYCPYAQRCVSEEVLSEEDRELAVNL